MGMLQTLSFRKQNVLVGKIQVMIEGSEVSGSELKRKQTGLWKEVTGSFGF